MFVSGTMDGYLYAEALIRKIERSKTRLSLPSVYEICHHRILFALAGSGVLKPEGSRKVPAAPRRTQDRGPLRGHKHQLLSRRRQLSRQLCNLQSSEEGFQRDSTKAARASREFQTPRSRANGYVRRQLTVRLVDLILHH